MLVQTLQAEVRTLLGQGLFQSAVTLCHFVLSSTATWAEKLESLTLYGSALLGCDEYQRALCVFLQVQVLVKNASVSDQARFTVCQQIATCYIKLKQPKLAVESLECIPAGHRSVALDMQLANLYVEVGKTSLAIETFIGTLEKQPMAMEAMLALAKLGVDVRSLLQRTPGFSHDYSWILTLVDNYAQASKCQHQNVLKLLGNLDTQFPNNIHVLEHVAYAKMQSCSPEVACQAYERYHAADEFALQSKDLYAMSLFLSGKMNRLNVLTCQMLAIDENAPQPWVCAALHADSCNQKEKALQLIEKAIFLDENHAPAYLVKGQIYLSMGRAEVAVKSYRRAYTIDKSHFAAFAGLVESYLALHNPAPQFKSALITAKESLMLMPQNPKSLTLVGLVLSHSAEGRSKAAKAFNRALSLDKTCVPAIISLAKMLCSQRKFGEAIALILQHLPNHATDFMHCKLASIYALDGEIQAALQHYHIALSITPNYAPAVAAIDKLGNEDLDRSRDLDEDSLLEQLGDNDPGDL